jgi:hypothetical protein
LENQTTLAELGGDGFDPDSSRLIRTSWMLNADVTLVIEDPAVCIRFLDDHEARKLQESIQQRHVFSRHSYERSFYVTRAGELGGRSVIEVTLPGDPRSVGADARRIAAAAESVSIVSTVLYHSRRQLHNDLGIRKHRKEVVDLTVGPKMGHLSASSWREVAVRGVTLDKRFANRFRRLELDQVISAAIEDSPAGRRIQQSLNWLLESRMEVETPAAAIKCAIALETLLGRSSSEPLRTTLSERGAFLLSDDAETRSHLSRVIKTFYDARSAIVHGSTSKKHRGVTVGQLESAERIAFLVLVTLACNREDLGADASLQQWVDGRRWGAPRRTPHRPFRPGDLKRALEKGAKK